MLREPAERSLLRLQTSGKVVDSGYRQITGNDRSTERGGQLSVINAIKVLLERKKKRL